MVDLPTAPLLLGAPSWALVHSEYKWHVSVNCRRMDSPGELTKLAYRFGPRFGKDGKDEDVWETAGKFGTGELVCALPCPRQSGSSCCFGDEEMPQMW